MHLLCRSDNKRHSQTVNELRKAKDVGRDKWPITQPAAFKLLVKHANVLKNNNSNGNDNSRSRNNCFQRGAQFLQGNQRGNANPQDPVPDTNGRCFPDKTC